MLPRIILFNGPPRVGKDTAVNMTIERFRKLNDGPSCLNSKFAKIVKERTHAVLGIFVKPMPDVRAPLGIKFVLCHQDEPGSRIAPFDFFEDRKDVPLPEFHGKTAREAYIAVSELLFKPFFDDEIFGKLLITDTIDRNPTVDTFLISDSGFESEVRPLLARYGADAIKLIRVFREGADFGNDSRQYLDLSEYGIESFDLHNPAPMIDPTPAHRQAFLDNTNDVINALIDERAPVPSL